MSLCAGERLGPYEIVESIGKGGMGEVYRARDPRLDRDVAVKVSAAQFTERFEREARAVAAVNHPNICQIYDVGPNFIVMEFVEGKAPEGPMPLEDALRIARQIAAALEEAHEKGITHRDLKPANLKVKPDGTVKVLDFGLAKLATPAEGGTGEDSPTLSMAATQAGAILGTAAYMSPEQARGKRSDKRADIWAFGVVLYELITGTRLFEGEDVSHTMAAVIMQAPNLEAVPVEVRRLLQSCLEKDPKKRLRDIGDAWRMLDEPASIAAPTPAPPAAASTVAWLWPGIAAALLVALTVLVFLHFREKPPASQPLVRFDVDLGPDVSLAAPTGTSTVALSPDGTRLVYIAGNPSVLFLRKLDQAKATELPGTRGAGGPFFSPDGQWVGFFSNGKLNKISIEGGAVVPITTAPLNSGAVWGEDGSIVLSLGYGKGLGYIPAAGGPPANLTEIVGGELLHVLPRMLPGGKAAIFGSVAVPPDPDTSTIDVVTLADHKRKTIVRGGLSPRYVSGGYLLYTNKSTLFAVPFDPDKLETRGTATPVLDDVAFQASTYGAQYDVSANGTLVYRRGGGAAASLATLQWMDAVGKSQPLLAKAGSYLNPNLSSDGKRVALSITDESGRNIWVYDPTRDAVTRLTSNGVSDDAVWSPDGRYVVFTSIGTGILWTRSDGAGQPELLVSSKNVIAPRSFTPDGKRLAYVEIASSPQIWTVSLEDKNGSLKSGQPQQFLKDRFMDFQPEFSPDGRWLAYLSNESGRNEIYVRAFAPASSGQEGKWQISNNGGIGPLWSRTASELLYQSGDQIMAVNYTVKGDAFQAEKPRVWTEKLGGGLTPTLSADGKRVALVAPINASTPTQEHEVVFLQNFSDELRRKGR
jgi:serine/threonine-protein kinase